MWLPCIYVGDNQTTKKSRFNVGRVQNVDGTSHNVEFQLPLPTNRGGLKLYVSGVRYYVVLASATNYVDRVRLFGLDTAGTASTHDDDATNRTSATTLVTNNFAAVDVSGDAHIWVNMKMVVTAADLLIVHVPCVQCFYGT